MKPMFSPSLMCMDFLNITEQTEVLNHLCDFYHVDIMDGHFVKNITLSPDFVKAFSKIAKKPIDCHLMTTNPDDYIESLAEAGATYISPHAETINSDAFRILNKIESLGMKKGVVLNPATPVSSIETYLNRLDKVTVMTVDPGFAGQPFIPEMLEKIEQLKLLKEKHGYNFLIEVDGSCNVKTFERLAKAGTEVFVVGTSGLFSKAENLEDAWKIMMDEFNNCVKC